MSGFELKFEDDIAHIKLNNPDKRNSLSESFWYEFPKQIRKIDDEAQARVIVISATGSVFCAGIDVTMLANITQSGVDKTHPVYGAEFLAKIKKMQDTFSVLEECRIPVLAAIQGGCLGAGVDMISACDMRYATKNAWFCIAEINVGMVADLGTFPRILNHLPEGIVKELAYTGRKMDAEEALQYGLVNKVFDDEQDLVSGVMDMAKTIASKPPLAVYGSKKAIHYSRDNSTKDALDNIALWNTSFLNPAEIMEAMQARAQKRNGNFEDLPKKPK